MARFPGPRNADDEQGAEQRLRQLRSRFGRVSAGLGRRRGNDGTALPPTPFEIGIGLALGAFVLWAVVSFIS